MEKRDLLYVCSSKELYGLKSVTQLKDDNVRSSDEWKGGLISLMS